MAKGGGVRCTAAAAAAAEAAAEAAARQSFGVVSAQQYATSVPRADTRVLGRPPVSSRLRNVALRHVPISFRPGSRLWYPKDAGALLFWG